MLLRLERCSPRVDLISFIFIFPSSYLMIDGMYLLFLSEYRYCRCNSIFHCVHGSLDLLLCDDLASGI